MLPANVDIVIIHAGTNNLCKNKPFGVAEGIIQVGYVISDGVRSTKYEVRKLHSCHINMISNRSDRI